MELAGRVLGQTRFLVAGGIGPENVCTALRQSGAWGVDVSSGIEVSPGVKDSRLMIELMRGVGDSRRATACGRAPGQWVRRTKRKEPGRD